MAKVTSKHAVVVLAVGDKGRELLGITGDGIKKYAARIGADLHIIDGEPLQPDYPFEDKFRVGQYLDFYQRVIYLDADVVVADDAPDLFALVPETHLGICNELRYGRWDHTRDIQEQQKANGFRITRPKAYFNSGLIVISREHRAVMAAPTVPYRKYHCAEQDLVNARIGEYKIPVHEFGPDLVWLYFADQQGRNKQGKPFLHYAGASTTRGSRGHVVEMTGQPKETPAPDLSKIHRYFKPAMNDQEREKLYELLRRVDAVLQNYVVFYGGLLGYVRHGELLPWDDDLDLIALNLPSAEELQERLPDLKVLVDNHYLKVFDPKDPRIPGRQHSFPFLEINPGRQEGFNMRMKCAFGLPDDVYALDDVFPAVRTKFGPVETFVPKKATDLMVKKYGPQCLTTAKPPFWDHRNERRTHYPQTRWPLSLILNKIPVQQWYVINLDRRPDRMKEATEQLTEAGIPFTRFAAVDGSALPLPPNEKNGAGAFGCRLSHLRILEDALVKKLDCVGVLEDDVVLDDPETFKKRLEEVFAKLPSDWDMVYLGGQHRKPPTPTEVEGIVRCQDCHRTQSYVVRGQAIKKLFQIWSNETGHVDHILNRVGAFRQLKAYAVEPWMTGQGKSKSDINGRTQEERWWAPKGKVTVVKAQPAPDPNCKPCAKKAAIKAKLAELKAKRGR